MATATASTTTTTTTATTTSAIKTTTTSANQTIQTVMTIQKQLYPQQQKQQNPHQQPRRPRRQRQRSLPSTVYQTTHHHVVGVGSEFESSAASFCSNLLQHDRRQPSTYHNHQSNNKYDYSPHAWLQSLCSITSSQQQQHQTRAYLPQQNQRQKQQQHEGGIPNDDNKHSAEQIQPALLHRSSSFNFFGKQSPKSSHHDENIHHMIPWVIRVMHDGSDDDASDMSVVSNDDDDDVVATAAAAIVMQRQRNDDINEKNIIQDDLEEYLVNCYQRQDNDDDSVVIQPSVVCHIDVGGDLSRVAGSNRDDNDDLDRIDDGSGANYNHRQTQKSDNDRSRQKEQCQPQQNHESFEPGAVDYDSSFRGQDLPTPILKSSCEVVATTACSSIIVPNNDNNKLTTKKKKEGESYFSSCRHHADATKLLEETTTTYSSSLSLSSSSARELLRHDSDNDVDDSNSVPGNNDLYDFWTDRHVEDFKDTNNDDDDYGTVTQSKSNDSSFLFQSLSSSWTHRNHQRFSSITHSSTWGMTTATLEDDDEEEDENEGHRFLYDDKNRNRLDMIPSHHDMAQQQCIDHIPLSLLRLSTV